MTELPDIAPQGDERQTLTEFLDFQRTVMLRKTEGLTDEQAQLTCPPSDLTLASLLKHLAWVEDHWFVHVLRGEERSSPWREAPWDVERDWELTSAADDPLDGLVSMYREAWARSDEIVAGTPSLDAVASRSMWEGLHVSLRWILVHMIEEYARHLGHADFIRQSIDGVTGD